MAISLRVMVTMMAVYGCHALGGGEVFVPGLGVVANLRSDALAALQGFAPDRCAEPAQASTESRAVRMVADAVPPPLAGSIIRSSVLCFNPRGYDDGVEV